MCCIIAFNLYYDLVCYRYIRSLRLSIVLVLILYESIELYHSIESET